MNKILLIAPVMLFQTAFSQNTTNIYYDKNWKVTTKDKASFYRISPMKEVGELMLLQDFYMDGTPQFEGYTLKSKENSYVGDVVWYDANGNDENFIQYKNDTKQSTLTYYHPNGKIRKKAEYKNGIKQEVIIYSTDGNVLMKGIYENGKPSSGDFERIRRNDDYIDTETEEMLQVAADPAEENSERTVVVVPPPKIVPVTVPQSRELDSVVDSKKDLDKKTVNHKIFWAGTTQIAQETTFALTDYDFQPIKQKNYDASGKLIQTLNRNQFKEYGDDITNGTEFKYFLQNNFAKSLLSETKIIQSSPSGKAIYYMPDGKPSSETVFKDGSKIEEKLYDKSGTVKNKRIYRDNEPFNGNFDENIGELSVNVSYVNGKKEGEAIAKDYDGTVIAKGIYKNNLPYNGTFVVNTEGNSQTQKLLNVKNFKKDGLQKTFVYNPENLEETNTFKNDILDGPTTFYKDEKAVAIIIYKNNEPYDGTLLERKSKTLYKNGEVVAQTLFQDEYDQREQKTTLFERGLISKVIYNSFTITQVPQKQYEGIYKNGQPFSGYFETNEESEIRQIDYYENGEKKFQYSNDYIKNVDFYRHQTYNLKATYKNGKIFDGDEYITRERDLLIKHFENGALKSFDWDLFAVHYFNRIHFELKNDAIKITDFDSKKEAKITFTTSKDGVDKSLVIDGKTMMTINANQPESKDNNGNVVVYYLENQKIASRKYSVERESGQYSQSTELIFKIFDKVAQQDKNAADTFRYISENIGMDFLEENKEQRILAAVEYKADGNPKEGIIIITNPNGTYNLKLFLEGKLKSTVNNISMDYLEKEIEKLSVMK